MGQGEIFHWDITAAISGKVVPNLNNYRYIMLVLAYKNGSNYNCCSVSILPMNLFVSGLVFPQVDLHDGTTRRYARVQIEDDTHVKFVDFNNINGNWKVNLYGIK